MALTVIFLNGDDSFTLESLMEGVTDLDAVVGEVVEASLGEGGHCTKKGVSTLMGDWRVEYRNVC